jgi:hypothetical protein
MQGSHAVRFWSLLLAAAFAGACSQKPMDPVAALNGAGSPEQQMGAVEALSAKETLSEDEKRALRRTVFGTGVSLDVREAAFDLMVRADRDVDLVRNPVPALQAIEGADADELVGVEKSERRGPVQASEFGRPVAHRVHLPDDGSDGAVGIDAAQSVIGLRAADAGGEVQETIRIEASGLGPGVLNAEIRRGIGSSASRPLPSAVVRRHISINEMLQEVRLALSPVNEKVFRQE